MFEENGRINTNSEQGNKDVKQGKKVVCPECGKEVMLKHVEFGEEQICPKCGGLINGECAN